MSNDNSAAVETARQYYNSEDADNFYFTIWGGEDIHVGLYESDSEPIRDASRRTVEKLASIPTNLNSDSKVLDVGAGYGGAGRYLAAKYGCHCTSLNLSEVENERNRELSHEQGVADKIEVVDGNFESLPFGDASFDVIWSQDAFLHSGNREKVFEEIARVMRPGAEMVFTDPMQSDSCPEGVLQPILERIHLDSFGSPGFYREVGAKYGLETIAFHDMTHQLVNHYSRVLAETEAREGELRDRVSPEYIERMKRGLQHWIHGGQQGHLAWGIFHMRKKNA